MHCSACETPIAADDNYCRKCGMPVNIIDVPAVRAETTAVSTWNAAKPALVRGVALVAAGALLRALAGPIIRTALPRTFSGGRRDLLPLGGREAEAAEDIEILWYRRIRR
jgi:hypothetical protein